MARTRETRDMRCLGWAGAFVLALHGGGCSSDSFSPASGLGSGGDSSVAPESGGNSSVTPSETGGRAASAGGSTSNSPVSPAAGSTSTRSIDRDGGAKSDAGFVTYGDASTDIPTGGRSGAYISCPASMPVAGDACDLGGGSCYYASGTITCSCSDTWECTPTVCPWSMPADGAKCADWPMDCYYDNGAVLCACSGDWACVRVEATDPSCGGATAGAAPELAGRGGYADLGGFGGQWGTAGFGGVDSDGCPRSSPDDYEVCSGPGSVCAYEAKECVCTASGWRCLSIEGPGGSQGAAGAGLTGTPGTAGTAGA